MKRRLFVLTVLLSGFICVSAQNAINVWDFLVDYLANADGNAKLTFSNSYQSDCSKTNSSFSFDFYLNYGWFNLNYYSGHDIDCGKIFSDHRCSDTYYSSSCGLNIAYIPDYLSLTLNGGPLSREYSEWGRSQNSIKQKTYGNFSSYNVQIPAFQIVERMGNSVKFKVIGPRSSCTADYSSGDRCDLDGSVFTIPWRQNKGADLVGTLNMKPKNAITDEFGEWKWNADRTKIYLEPRNNSDLGPKLVIWNIDGSLSLNIEFPGFLPQIITSENNQLFKSSIFLKGVVNPIELMFTKVDITTSSDVVKANVAEENLFSLGSYNRFTGAVIDNSSSIINQLSSQRDIILKYNVANGNPYMFVYHLEGLESILNYLQ